MRTAVLIRDPSTSHGTLGRFVAEGLELHMIEPPWRNNRPNRSCIPAGVYRVRPHVSPRFGRCLQVEAVEGRSHILQHAGNVAGDVETGYHTHSLGCQLPGINRGKLVVKGRRQLAVLSSRTALRHLMAWADGRPYRMEVHDA